MLTKFDRNHFFFCHGGLLQCGIPLDHKCPPEVPSHIPRDSEKMLIPLTCPVSVPDAIDLARSHFLGVPVDHLGVKGVNGDLCIFVQIKAIHREGAD